MFIANDNHRCLQCWLRPEFEPSDWSPSVLKQVDKRRPRESGARGRSVHTASARARAAKRTCNRALRGALCANPNSKHAAPIASTEAAPHLWHVLPHRALPAAKATGDGALLVSMVDCRRRRHRLPVRPHGGRPTAPAPAPCTSPWWIADGGGTGALCVPIVTGRRLRHPRSVRPHGGLPTAAAPAPCASPWWTAAGAGTGATCVHVADTRRRLRLFSARLVGCGLAVPLSPRGAQSWCRPAARRRTPRWCWRSGLGRCLACRSGGVRAVRQRTATRCRVMCDCWGRVSRRRLAHRGG